MINGFPFDFPQASPWFWLARSHQSMNAIVGDRPRQRDLRKQGDQDHREQGHQTVTPRLSCPRGKAVLLAEHFPEEDSSIDRMRSRDESPIRSMRPSRSRLFFCSKNPHAGRSPLRQMRLPLSGSPPSPPLSVNPGMMKNRSEERPVFALRGLYSYRATPVRLKHRESGRDVLAGIFLDLSPHQTPRLVGDAFERDPPWPLAAEDKRQSEKPSAFPFKSDRSIRRPGHEHDRRINSWG